MQLHYGWGAAQLYFSEICPFMFFFVAEALSEVLGGLLARLILTSASRVRVTTVEAVMISRMPMCATARRALMVFTAMGMSMNVLRVHACATRHVSTAWASSSADVKPGTETSVVLSISTSFRKYLRGGQCHGHKTVFF